VIKSAGKFITHMLLKQTAVVTDAMSLNIPIAVMQRTKIVIQRMAAFKFRQNSMYIATGRQIAVQLCQLLSTK